MATFSRVDATQELTAGTSIKVGSNSNPITAIYQDNYNTSFSFDGSGGGTSNIVTVQLTRIGNLVIASVTGGPTATSGTASNNFTANSAMPSNFWPSTTTRISTSVVSSYGGSLTGTVSSAGILTLNWGILNTTSYTLGQNPTFCWYVGS